MSDRRLVACHHICSCEAKVKAVFEACGVKQAFHKYEEETAAKLRNLIDQVHEPLASAREGREKPG